MNKLINTWNRGFSLKNDDLRFVDAAVRMALSDLAKGFNSKNAIILWGCEVTVVGTVATVTEGAIYFLSEVFHVNPHTFVVPNPLTESPLWCAVAEWDAAGAKTDVDLQAHQAYQIRKVVGSMTAIAGQLGSALFDATSRIPDINLSSADIPLPANVTLANNYLDCKVMLLGGIVTLEMGVAMSAPSAPPAATNIGTIPVGFRPRNYLNGICYGYTANGVKAMTYYVNKDSGVISVVTLDGSSMAGALCVLNISFRVAS